MIISCLSQKGGSGKTTLARGIAVEFVKNGWDVHVVDTDLQQLTLHTWAGRRDAVGIEPSIDVASYRTPNSALRATARCDLLIVDGAPSASQDTAYFASQSDLIIIPCKSTDDDFIPALGLAQELTVKKGIDRQKILFVITQVPDNGENKAKKRVEELKGWGFDVAPTWMLFQQSFGDAMDAGYCMTETRYNTLNERAGAIIQYIGEKAAALATIQEEDHA